MKQNNKIMHTVWNKAAENIANKNIELELNEYSRLITSLFCPGPHYYYIIDFFDRQLKQLSPDIETILGLDAAALKFDDILNAIHPDDIAFVAKAEGKAIKYFYASIVKDKILKYKTCYCFRLRVADGSYQLFQHQAIVLTIDENGGFGKSLNIHTNINHITKVNNHKVYIIGIENNAEIIEIDMNDGVEKMNYSSFFSKRESMSLS